MKKILVFLLGLAVIASCKKDPPAPTPAPTPPIVVVEPPDTNNYNLEGELPCFTCNGETLSETYKDVEGIVTRAGFDRIRGVNSAWVISITKSDIALGTGGYSIYPDSILITCKRIPVAYEVVGKKVKISGQLMNCGGILTCPVCLGAFGRKFILTKIKSL